MANLRYSPRPCLRFHCTLARALATEWLACVHAFSRALAVSDGNDTLSSFVRYFIVLDMNVSVIDSVDSHIC